MQVDWNKVGIIAGLVGLIAWLADSSADEKAEEKKGIAPGEPNNLKGLNSDGLSTLEMGKIALALRVKRNKLPKKSKKRTELQRQIDFWDNERGFTKKK